MHWYRNFKQSQSGSFIVEMVKVIVIALVIVVPIRMVVAEPYVVRGTSMVEQFHNQDYLIVNKISYRFNDPRREDVIVFKYPEDPSEFFIKRIIGVPGDTVRIADGAVYLTKGDSEVEELLAEDYLSSDFETTPDGRWVVGADEYFVLGDNRPYSSDSRRWGLLPRENIIGKAYLRLWPFSDIKYLP